MITTGVIKKINISGGNHKNNKVIAEVSLFKSSSNTNPESYSCECNCSVPGGIYSPYNVGDKVYIGFLNDKKTNPVILGKIYQGLEEESRSFAYFNKLKVKANTELSEDTKIGQLTGKDLVNIKNDLRDLTNKVNSAPNGVILIRDRTTNFYGYQDSTYNADEQIHTNTYIIAHNGTTYLTIDEIKNYTKYMTGIAYVPEQQHYEVFKDALLFTNGNSGYLETQATEEAGKYNLFFKMVRNN